ncbi:hypothetical protein AMELA_G00275270 [Ameiurus melas]|uniref:Uncharacterized protein n=1 Tax=Ameiurus melas TaxID=219545 RepID=A0A7J5ZMD2_AMEME|nr:hypothetical protein AMELA_G00275270 [Ameiurus melas]
MNKSERPLLPVRVKASWPRPQKHLPEPRPSPPIAFRPRGARALPLSPTSPFLSTSLESPLLALRPFHCRPQSLGFNFAYLLTPGREFRSSTGSPAHSHENLHWAPRHNTVVPVTKSVVGC